MQALEWNVDGADWPHRQTSRFARAAGIRWHVQSMGRGPSLLLIHGTAAGTFSWRGLAPLLAENFSVVMADLPGHAFTEALHDAAPSLEQMSRALGDLLIALEVEPQIVVGHSAGAAIALRMTLDSRIAPIAVVSVNGALLPQQGLAGLVFSPAAKLLAASSLFARIAARRATNRRALQNLLASTGSTLDEQGIDLYGRVVGNAAHVSGVLNMMANWNLQSLQRDVVMLRAPLTLIVGETDGTVDPAESQRLQCLLPTARIVRLPGLGHLAHEEQPALVAAAIVAAFRAQASNATT